MIRRLSFANSTFLIALILGMISPSSEASWRYVGPDGGPALALMIDADDSDRLLLSSQVGELFESTDGGLQFSAVVGTPRSSDSFGSPVRFSRIVQSPSASDILLGAARLSNPRVWRSANGGRTWMSVATVNENDGILVADVSFNSDGSRAYALAANEFFVSSDGGASWRAVSLSGAPDDFIRSGAIIISSPSDPSGVFILSSSRVIKSEDGGENWQELANAPERISEFTVGISGILFLFSETQIGKVFRSTDGGDTWTAASVDLLDPEGNPVQEITDFAAQSTTGIIFALSEGRIHRSSDNGLSWTSITLPVMIDFPEALDFDRRDSDRLFILSNTGLFFSVDGGENWSLRAQGFRGHAVERMNTNRAAPETIYADTTYTVLSSSDKGISWSDLRPRTTLNDSLYRPVASSTNPSTLVAVFDGLGIPARSTDGGASWLELAPTSPVFLDGLSLLVWSDPRDDNRLIAGGFGVPSLYDFTGLFLSTDAGSTWSRVFEPPAERLNFQANSVIDDPTRPGTAFFGIHSRTDQSFNDGLILRTTDGGSSFDELIDGFAFPEVAIDSVGTIFVGGFRQSTRAGVWRSIDGGDSWEKSSTGIPEGSSIWDVVAHPSVAGVVVASTAFELFVSVDNGASWEQLSRQGIGTGNSIRSVEILSGSGTALELMVGTNGGLYYTPKAEIVRAPSTATPVPSLKIGSMFFLAGLILLFGWIIVGRSGT